MPTEALANTGPEAFPPDPREFRWIPAHALIVDERVQRELDPERVARIRNEFTWRLFEALTVSATRHKNAFNVEEGQHRTAALKGLDPNALVPCMVLPKMDDAERAEVALAITRARRFHTAYEQWRLKVVGGHEHEVLATAAMEARGVRVGKAPSAMTIGAVATVVRITHGGQHTPEYGAELLGRTIDVLMAAFPTYDHDSNANRWNRDLLLSVAEVLRRNPDTVDDGRLAVSYKIRPAIQWVNLGRAEPRPPYEVITDAVLKEYNRGLRNGKLS